MHCLQVAARKDLRSSETNDGKQNGTTWAFEVGNELLACPIVVEDLSYPGHMLIEVGPLISIFRNHIDCKFLVLIAQPHSIQMLCNEQSLFLEIAQVIRSSELTILKGVMENRCNNTWAHFIVEVSFSFRDFSWEPIMNRV